MAPFKVWDVVKLPFPYTDRPVRQRRPALVISAGEMLETAGLIWVMMITSAENRGWECDVQIQAEEAGLPAPSVVRTWKIACIDAKDAELLGRIRTKKHRELIANSIETRFRLLNDLERLNPETHETGS
jgi:mRNA interferase MazF